jgi:transposase InsO family protein
VGFPLKSKKASETAYHLYRLFCDWGAPKVLQSDNGGEFVNNTLAGLAKEWNFTLVTGKAYNPREQGKVEHLNGTIAAMLGKHMHDHNTR